MKYTILASVIFTAVFLTSCAKEATIMEPAPTPSEAQRLQTEGTPTTVNLDAGISPDTTIT